MFEDALSLVSIFASMNSWLTPTVLFLLLNLMIGTIAVTSGFTSHKPNHNNHHSQPVFHHHNHHIHHPQPPQPTLTRSPSVLQRLKSTINLSSFYSQPPIEQLKPDPEPEPEPKPDPESRPINPNDDPDEGPTLDEVYLKIKQGNVNPNYGRQNSDTKPSNGEIPVRLPQKMKKSASDTSAFGHFEHQEIITESAADNVGPPIIMEDEDDDGADVEERENGVVEREDEGVDAKADDFINRFKLQLQLQRKESMLRDYKQMIHSRTTDAQ